MLFNSFSFLIFFPSVTLIYFLLPSKLRPNFLLGAGTLFYMAYIPKYILVLAAIIFLDFSFAKIMEKSKGRKRTLLLALSLFSNISFLLVFKYLGFFNQNLTALANFLHWNYSLETLSFILPLGLSFHTFQSMAYTLEVYKKKQKAEKNLVIYALYVMFYPQLVSGPIERPQHLIPQLKKKHDFEYKRVTEGLKLMVWGFFQKLVIADRLALFVNPVFGNVHSHTGFALLAATFFFAFQIYCDFAGYTDIARGSAKVMGFNLIPNFDSPYLATSVRNFWRRWHMSLSSWFRDYLYIPLGGSRGTFFKTCRNILIVFSVTGFWHGASWTFGIWGLLHGVYIVAENLAKKTKFQIQKPASIILTFIAISFSWIFFRAQNLADAKYIVFNLLNFKNNSFQTFPVNKTQNDLFIAFLLIFFIMGIQIFKFDFGTFRLKNSLLRWAVYYILIFSILLLGIFSQSKFIYFQF